MVPDCPVSSNKMFRVIFFLNCGWNVPFFALFAYIYIYMHYHTHPLTLSPLTSFQTVTWPTLKLLISTIFVYQLLYFFSQLYDQT